jgi:hypothetical protein
VLDTGHPRGFTREKEHACVVAFAASCAAQFAAIGGNRRSIADYVIGAGNQRIQLYWHILFLTPHLDPHGLDQCLPSLEMCKFLALPSIQGARAPVKHFLCAYAHPDEEIGLAQCFIKVGTYACQGQSS